MVLIDEGQDQSPIMLDALGHCRRQIIIVGDSHQQIYSFRYAIDAMKRFPYPLPFFLEGNIGATFGRILDVYWL